MSSISEKPAAPVSRRLVLLFPGFEAMPAEAHCRRFIRELRKTAPVYGFSVPAEVPVNASGLGAGFDISATGEDWTATTEVIVYGLEDVNSVYAARHPLARFVSGAGALADFLLSRTFFRFVATSWRYSLFFLYPVVITAAIMLIAYLAFSGIVTFSGYGSWPWGIAAAVAVAALLFLIAARKMHFLLMMDDWTFARDIAREARPDIQARLDTIADDIAKRVVGGNADEVTFAGHSFGAITAVSVLASLMHRHPELSRSYGLLTAGSSLLKVALHPAATRLRKAVETVVHGTGAWLDVQSLTDPMNFYKTNPPQTLGIRGGKPVRTMRVRFRSQLSPATYKAIRRNLFRVHRQFVYGVERRGAYSFHAILCGPEPFSAVAARPGLPENWRSFNGVPFPCDGSGE